MGGRDVGEFQRADPVPFDFEAARDLAAKLKSSAQLVSEQQLPRRRQVAATARKDWQGTYADIFDTRMKQCTDDADRLAKAMVDAAAKVEALAKAAEEEQRRIDRANEYLVEHAAWRERERVRRDWDIDSVRDVWDIATGKLDKEPEMPTMTGTPPSPLLAMDPNITPRET